MFSLYARMFSLYARAIAVLVIKRVIQFPDPQSRR